MLRKGATNDGASMVPIDAYRTVRYFPGIASDAATGEPLVSPEMVVQPFFYRADGGRENVLVRGVRPVAFAVHKNVRIAQGRAPRSSSGEALVGRAVAARYPAAATGFLAAPQDGMTPATAPITNESAIPCSRIVSVISNIDSGPSPGRAPVAPR